MPEFIYEAQSRQSPDDQPDPVGGRISAENVSAAIVELESQGLDVQSIRQVKPEDDLFQRGRLNFPNNGQSFQWLPRADREVLEQRIARVLQRREVLAPALAALAEEMPQSRYRRELRSLVARLESGTTAEEFCASPDLMKTWLPLLAGSGSPVESGRLLQEMLTETTYEQDLSRRRRRTWAYPLLVMFIALAVLVFLSIATVPVISDIFDDFDLDLPVLTQGVVWLSEAVRFLPLRLLSSLAAIVGMFCGAIWLMTSWGPTAEIWGYCTRGSSRELNALAGFTRRLAELVRAGVSLPTSLRLAAQDCSRVRLRRAVEELATYAEDDRVVLSGASVAKVFPSTLVYSLQSDDGKPNSRLLEELAGLYGDRARNRFHWTIGMGSQFAVVLVGIMVGFIVLALLLPLVELINGLTG